MDKISKRLFIVIVFLLAASMACGRFGGGTPEPEVEEATLTEVLPTLAEEVGEKGALPTVPPVETQAGEIVPTGAVEEPGTVSESYDTEFPLPENVNNFMQVPQSEAGINFQTDMGLEDVVAFYRGEFTSQGLTERQLLTMVEETAFSIVFDGASNGMAIVIQGVAFGPDQTNVNIRYEDL